MILDIKIVLITDYVFYVSSFLIKNAKQTLFLYYFIFYNFYFSSCAKLFLLYFFEIFSMYTNVHRFKHKYLQY